MVTSPKGATAAASARIPSECTPSSLVTSIRGIGTFDDITPQEQCRGDRGKAGAYAERRRRSVTIIEKPEHDARGECTDAEDGVVESECRAASCRGGQIRNERLLRSLGQRKVETVEKKPEREHR